MEKNTLECPIFGLLYERHAHGERVCYALSPKDGYRMRVRALEAPSSDEAFEPRYLRKLFFPAPYDFDNNPMAVESEAT